MSSIAIRLAFDIVTFALLVLLLWLSNRTSRAQIQFNELTNMRLRLLEQRLSTISPPSPTAGGAQDEGRSSSTVE